jgi:hypothetical protein
MRDPFKIYYNVCKDDFNFNLNVYSFVFISLFISLFITFKLKVCYKEPLKEIIWV